MSDTPPAPPLGAPHWPVEVRLKRAEKILEVTFDNGVSFRYPAELLRVESPSAEVQGHGPSQKQLVAGRAHVGILELEAVGNYAIRIKFDDLHLAYPEYRGNGVMASLGNIDENPHVGLLMVDFVRDRIGLHVNGRALIVENDELGGQFPDLPQDRMPGRRPERWVVVAVEEAYVHCRKHIPQMIPIEGRRAWGTDDAARKGGDYFGAKATLGSAGN